MGLDVYARSMVAAAINGVTEEVFRAGLSPNYGQVVQWVQALPGPAAVAYESGPPGFELARALTPQGIRCKVAAPSKLLRPSGGGSRPTPGTRCTRPGRCGCTR